MFDDSDQIRRRMAELRNQSADSAVELHAALGRVTDWKEHVRAHPLLTTGLALAAGYWVVPQRDRPQPVSKKRRAKEAEAPATEEEVHKSSMAGGAIGGLIGNVVASAVRGYLTNLLRQQLTTRFGGHATATTSPPMGREEMRR